MDYECLQTQNDNQKENSNSLIKSINASTSTNKSALDHQESIDRSPEESREDSANKLTDDNPKTNKQIEDNDEEITDQDVKNLTSSIDLLIKAATLTNPKQFQLPPELQPSINLPGISRKPFSSQMNVNKSKKQIYESENGVVTGPVKTCFKCDKNCRKSCLIQCDYCPLLYHLDCLDPPLTYPPTTRWMCPNHVEQILEEKLLESAGLSERIKLWEKYTEIHGETVKLNFIKKASRRSAPYRVKVRTVPQNLIRVPESVKKMYRRPVNLIPDTNVISADIRVNEPIDNQNESSKPNEQEKLEWLSSLVEFQNSVTDYLKCSKPINVESQPDEMQTYMNEFLNLDQDQIKMLAWEKYKERLGVPNNQQTIKNQLNSSLKDDASIDTVSLTEEQTYQSKSDSTPVKRKATDNDLSCNSFSRIRATLCPIIIDNNLIRGNCVQMRSNCLRIGCDSSMDLNLVNYGHCNYISDKHALIFYDEVGGLCLTRYIYY